MNFNCNFEFETLELFNTGLEGLLRRDDLLEILNENLVRRLEELSLFPCWNDSLFPIISQTIRENP